MAFGSRPIFQLLICQVVLGTMIWAQTVEPPSDSVAVQLPADQKALQAARESTDPKQRIALLKKFLRDYPASKRADAAHTDLLETLIASFPDRKRAIHKEAQYEISHASALHDKAEQENVVAYDMAEAKPNGVDLKSAEKWVKDALAINTEAEVRRDLLENAVRDQRKPLEESTIRRVFNEDRTNMLQTLAEVYFHEGKFDEANQTLDAADLLVPNRSDVLETRGKVALAQNHAAEALNEFELASVYGTISDDSKSAMMRLYRETQGGSNEQFEVEMDALYRKLLPETAPPPHASVSAAHTALVELFTGSGCEPCVGADLALDRLLLGYTNKEVVSLEYDMHIPRPDPLTSPDGLARAKYYSVQYTPWIMVDGVQILDVGGPRSETDKLYSILEKGLDATLPWDFGVTILLKADINTAGIVTATALASVALPEQTAEKLLAVAKTNEEAVKAAKEFADQIRATKLKAGNAEPLSEHAKASPSDPLHLTMNFALAQGELRYTGENGIRFHRMVVRALAKPDEEGFSVDMRRPASQTATFDTAALSKSLSRYLEEFPKHNKRFGSFKFLSTDTSIPQNGLSVVAWVENPGTHQVVAAAVAKVANVRTAAAK